MVAHPHRPEQGRLLTASSLHEGRSDTDMLVEGRQGSRVRAGGSTTYDWVVELRNQRRRLRSPPSLFIDDIFLLKRRLQGIEEMCHPPSPASRALGRCQEIYLLFAKKFLGWSLYGLVSEYGNYPIVDIN